MAGAMAAVVAGAMAVVMAGAMARGYGRVVAGAATAGGCSHILTVQSAEHERKSFGLKLFQRT